VYINRTSKHVTPSKKRKTRRQEKSGIVVTKQLRTQYHRGTNVSSSVCQHILLTCLNYSFLTFSCAVLIPPKYVSACQFVSVFPQRTEFILLEFWIWRISCLFKVIHENEHYSVS
jgi:hypothetical protein